MAQLYKIEYIIDRENVNYSIAEGRVNNISTITHREVFMRTVPAIILTATLFLSSYAGTVILRNQTWMSFRPVPPSDFSCTVSSNPPSCSSDSTDFYWKYFEGCVCLCACCPSIAVASKRPFYVSRKPMNFGDYTGDTAKLADTNLFVKCSTSTSQIDFGCSPPYSFSSAALLFGPYGLVPDGADSLRTRLLVFRTRFNNYPPLRYVPLKIDSIVSWNPYCPWGTSTAYDAIQVTFGNTLTGTAVPARVAPASRSALHVAKTGAGYVISGFGKGRSSLEIVNGRGKTVYCRPVFSSSYVIGKNILGPGIYFIRVHSRAGISSIMLPVH